jgi:acetyltransferase-like isoleucine patch superfamily enzyme
VIRYILRNYKFSEIFKILFDLYLWPLLKIFNGIEGILLRRLYLNLFAKQIGRKIVFDSGIYLRGSYNLSLGDNVLIQANCHLACQGEIEIGANSVIGPGTIIVTNDHKFLMGGNNFVERSFVYRKVYIGKNTIIGANCFINAGVTIGDNCLISAGTVININIRDNEHISSNYCDSLNNNLKKTLINIKNYRN